MADVPIELIPEILSHLPVDSLLRFKSVCKSWRSLIEDPNFARYHLHRQTPPKEHFFIGSTGTKLYTLSLNLLKCSEQGINITELTATKKFLPGGAISRGYPAAWCDGLILRLHQDIDKRWALWNPFTREFLELPPIADLTMVPRSLGQGRGIGYDVVTDDYKVVRVTLLCDSIYRLETLVYSLKSHEWRRVDDFPNCGLAMSMDPGVFVNGALHWIAYLEREGIYRKCIIAFDLGTETYRVISMPEAGRGSSEIVTLKGLDGCLFLCCHIYVMGKLGCMDVWKMNDCGGKDLWIKFFSFKRPANMRVMETVRPIAYLKNKEVVLLLYNCEELVWLDIKKESAIFFSVNGIQGSFGLRAFPRSLVQLNQ